MTRAFFNDEAHQHLDNVVTSDRTKRELARLVEQDDNRLSQIMADQYGDTHQRVTSELDFALRICGDGEDTVEAILSDLRDGNITAREAATQLGAAKRDLNKVRKLVSDLPATEERAWESVNKSPGEFQRDVAKRFPALFQNGRGLVVLPTEDD